MNGSEAGQPWRGRVGGPPFVVAEISGNHNGSLARAIEIVHMVAEAGADAVKLQTYTPDTLTLAADSADFRVSSEHELWGGRTLYDLYEEAQTPWEWHAPIFIEARKVGLIPFSTPFDETSVDFLEELDVLLYKIASLEIVDLPLIRKVAATGKPLILSTGAATWTEVADAVTCARSAGCEDLTVLVCTSSYPASAADANLRRLPVLAELLDVSVGLSDHTLGTAVSVAAVAMGATVIEKHVTLSRADGGVDGAFSLDATGFKVLIRDVREAWEALGSADAWRAASEAESLRFRPSLRVTQDVKAGELLSSRNVRSVRPAGGLQPDDFTLVEGRRFIRDAELGTPVTWDLVT